jgi:large repetitive protein
MYRRDVRHSGRAPQPGPTAPRVRWQFVPAPGTLPLSSDCPPSIAADGTIYTPRGGELLALSPDGKMKWSAKASGRCGSAPAIGADGTVYARATGLTALGPDGTERWSFAAPVDELQGALVIASDGTIYVSSDAGTLYALRRDGSVQWSFLLGTKGTSPALGIDGTVYVTGDAMLYALNSRGEKKWEAPLSASQPAVPVIAADGTIYITGGDQLAAFSSDGAMLWAVAAPGHLGRFPPAIGPDGTIFATAWGSLVSYEPNGTERRRIENQMIQLETPIVDSDGTVYFAGHGCIARAVSRDGNEKWAVPLGAPIGHCGSPVMGADGTLYFTSASEGLIALGDEP